MNMENLSLLNVKCLANVPMFLDVLSVSVGKVKSVITPYFDEFKTMIERELSSVGYIIGRWENGTIYALGFNDSHKKCYIEELTPELELRYALSFEQTKKKNPRKFEIDFGYICDESQNVIYFQLSEYSEKIELIDEDFAKELNQAIPNDWEKGGENNCIYVQFSIDEKLSDSKINECATVFRKYILDPFFHKVKK